jgi:hypothetical protein
MRTSPTFEASKFILLNAPLMAKAPSAGAVIVDNAPIKLPMGVLAAETITTSFIKFIFIICEFNKLMCNGVRNLGIFQVIYRSITAFWELAIVALKPVPDS